MSEPTPTPRACKRGGLCEFKGERQVGGILFVCAKCGFRQEWVITHGGWEPLKGNGKS